MAFTQNNFGETMKNVSAHLFAILSVVTESVNYTISGNILTLVTDTENNIVFKK